MKHYELIIIGGGSAGMASALSAKEAGLKNIVILERECTLGGILNQCIHNGFGLQIFKEELSGPEYAYRYREQIEKTDIEIKLNTHVITVNKDKQVEYVNPSEGYETIEGDAIIFAVGCYERSAGSIALGGDRPYGIFTAGCAQKYLNINNILVGKKVFILGSGDIGLIMARRMTLEGANVLGVAEREPYSNGLMRNIVQCLEDFDIPLYTSHTVTSVKGKKHLQEITISALDDNYQAIKGSEKTFEVDTLLLSVGLVPENSLMRNVGLSIDQRTHGMKVNEALEGSIPGFFACGNALHVHDLVDFVSKEAQRAGKSAANYIRNKKEETKEINTIAGDLVSYILPQRISLHASDISISMRVRKPLKRCTIQILIDDTIVKEIKKPYLLPAEMVTIPFKMELMEADHLMIQISEESL